MRVRIRRYTMGGNALWNAAGVGDVAAVLALLAAGEDVNQKGTNFEQETPLYAAAKEGHELVVRLLLENGAAVNQATYDHETPLLAAAGNGHELVVRALLEKRATEVNPTSETGDTPVYRRVGRARVGGASAAREPSDRGESSE